MKHHLIALGLTALFFNGAVFACEIYDKKKVHRGFYDGIAGVCSNNGRKIQCLYVGKHSGGITCSGPQATNSGYNLKNLIYSVCGCKSSEINLKEQIDREFE
jgi:hypothetical protein